MKFEVKVVADSISPVGKRIVTLTATYPRMIHSELMTHRAFARNAASSRAIPFKKMVQTVQEFPFVPIKWGAEQRGMQTGDEIPQEQVSIAESLWLNARDDAVKQAVALHELGIHKSLCNRLLEPFAWITTVITATEWANFFRLRVHPDAEIHFQRLAGYIQTVMGFSEPRRLDVGEWHLPFIDEVDRIAVLEEFPPTSELSADEALRRCSVARCARVSYLTHEGKRDILKDLDLFEKLANGSGFGHWSPHEHAAQATGNALYRSGPFVGWHQYRSPANSRTIATDRTRDRRRSLT